MTENRGQTSKFNIFKEIMERNADKYREGAALFF